MKKAFLLLSAAVLVVSCNNQEEHNPNNGGSEQKTATLTFEDDTYAASANYIGESDWSSLIDIENGGELLYNYDDNYNANSEYQWYDENNTYLASEITVGEYGTAFFNGGVALSNYHIIPTEEAPINYTNQLSIPYVDKNGKSGYNGSDNFAIGFHEGYLYFGDDKARTIDHMYVATTSYWLSVALFGDGEVEGIASEDWYKITATSVDAEGNSLATSEFYLAKDGKILEGWNKWDLTSLGEVTKVIFTAEGSLLNQYGSALPGYFAIDNITVVME